jgi:hypothetical protein
VIFSDNGFYQQNDSSFLLSALIFSFYKLLKDHKHMPLVLVFYGTPHSTSQIDIHSCTMAVHDRVGGYKKEEEVDVK